MEAVIVKLAEGLFLVCSEVERDGITHHVPRWSFTTLEEAESEVQHLHYNCDSRGNEVPD